MNTLSIDVTWQPCGLSGYWLAKYTPWRTTRPQTVKDANGKPIRYPTAEKAKVAAGEALIAELNRVEAMRFDPVSSLRVKAEAVFKKMETAQ